MGYLKKQNLNKCFSLLREFVEGATAQGNEKGTAIMALDQLKKVIAGAEEEMTVTIMGCNGIPIADWPIP